MSVDYYFACGKCMQCIHVAQDGLGGWTFYSGEPGCMQELGEFLGEHSLCRGVLLLPEHEVEEYTQRLWKRSEQQPDARSLLETVVREVCEQGGLSEETCQLLDVALGRHIEMERPSRLESEFAKVADDPIAKAMLKLGEGPHCPTCDCGAKS